MHTQSIIAVGCRSGACTVECAGQNCLLICALACIARADAVDAAAINMLKVCAWPQGRRIATICVLLGSCSRWHAPMNITSAQQQQTVNMLLSCKQLGNVHTLHDDRNGVMCTAGHVEVLGVVIRHVSASS